MRLLVWLYLSSALLYAQETRGMISGRVLDPQGTTISGASVTVTNPDTGASSQLKSNETGYYEANLLLPGNYQVSADAAGFRKLVRSGIVLTVSTRLEINLEMQLGALAETVTVSAEAPMLETSTVSSGRVMDNRTLMNIPVIGSNATVLVKLTPGIQTSGVNNWLGLHSNIGNSDYSTAGNVGGNEWAIDGVPNDGPSRRTAYMPHADTVQEFKVETSNFDASIGHTTGASVFMMTKAGMNSLHGTVTEEHWQQRWNGTPFFVKQLYYRNIAAAEASGNTALAQKLRSEDKQPSGHEHNYAATIGGPIVLPKIYNGKNKLFFFFSYNGFKDIRSEEPTAINRTIPTLANRRGDFSQLLSVDARRYQIHDPLSVRPDPARPGNFIRDPFAGNILPPSRTVNPAYNSYVKLLPNPNSDPADPRREPVNNYVAVATPLNFKYDALANRVDYHHSASHRFFGRWSWNDYNEDRGDWTYESARGLHTSGLSRWNVGATVDWVWTVSPSTVLDFAVAGNDFRDGNKITAPFQFKPSDVGLPAYLDTRGDQPILPQMNFSGYQTVGRGVPAFIHYRILTGKADLSHVRGKHSVRAGFDSRQHFRTGGGGGNSSGVFSFSNAYTRRNDDTFTPAGDLGLSWAAFMMGLPDGISIATNDTYATHTPYQAGYVQDNWRLTPRLTLNLGLRLEYENGATERYNRVIGDFDAAAKLPITDAAQAAYARSPVPELAASSFSVLGGSLYPGVGGVSRRLWDSALMWLPRAAAAYQLNTRTVLRGGYGLFYDTLNVLNEGPDQTGFSRSTNTVLTTDFGVNWRAGNPQNGISPLTDPFPVREDGTRFDVPVRGGLGLMARAGRGWSFLDFHREHARQQRWRVSLQRQFGTHMVIDVAYAGSRSDRVRIARSLSPLPERFWAGGQVRNDTVANNLNSNVANPFNIRNFAALQSSQPLIYQDMATQGFFTSTTIRKSSLLRPFPQMNVLTNSAASDGEVKTHELQITVERRFSRGMSFNAGYTRLHIRAADYFHDEFDAAPAWRDSNNTRPHRLVGTAVYELPFGKGRAWAREGVMNHLLGGFQLSATYEWQPGPLLDFGNLFYNGDLEDITKGTRTLSRWFNTDGFERTAARGPAAFHRRVFPTRIDGLRSDMTNQWNTSLQREFRIKERVGLQLRLDAINLQNRSQMNPPERNPFSTNFGVITTQSAALNRLLQVHGRLQW
ncbi:MAG: TonB-dependent receptor domain-containing protein [Bryobacteraceae bacterium]